MNAPNHEFGILDNRVLAKSVGLLNPPTPVAMHETSRIRDAIAALQESRLGAVIVIQDDGRLCGIFTERDVVLKAFQPGIDLDTTPLSEVMTSSPHTQTMTSTMAFCLTMMSEGGYRHIPIVDDDDIPIGLVSVKDIVDYIVGQLQLDLGTIAHGESASAHSRV